METSKLVDLASKKDSRWPFKLGDRVKLIHNNDYEGLKEGTITTIDDGPTWAFGSWVVSVKLNGMYFTLIASRFELVAKSDELIVSSDFNGKCSLCGSPAYVGFMSTECSNKDCENG